MRIDVEFSPGKDLEKVVELGHFLSEVESKRAEQQDVDEEFSHMLFLRNLLEFDFSER